MNFAFVAKQNEVTIGKLDGDDWPGVYLSSEYIARLGEVHLAVTTRLAALEKSEIPDAVLNLLGILGRMFSVYTTAVQPERDARHEEQMAKATEALNKIQELLDGFNKH